MTNSAQLAAGALALMFIACTPPPPPATVPVWVDTNGATKLASGGVHARLDGIGEAVDIGNPHNEIAMAQYVETHQTEGNDAGSVIVTTRYIVVTSGKAGATTLTLYRRGTSTVVAPYPLRSSIPRGLPWARGAPCC
jgi:hypothetical protein